MKAQGGEQQLLQSVGDRAKLDGEFASSFFRGFSKADSLFRVVTKILLLFIQIFLSRALRVYPLRLLQHLLPQLLVERRQVRGKYF